MQIAGTTAIVTGAASGLGLATAELLASAGAKVAGLDIAVADAGMDDDGILRHPCDVTSETSVQAVLANPKPHWDRRESWSTAPVSWKAAKYLAATA
jgi:NAD(P)-dependent dehydrogenase (short-subunit alcohol dehydrogenase family)